MLGASGLRGLPGRRPGGRCRWRWPASARCSGFFVWNFPLGLDLPGRRRRLLPRLLRGRGGHPAAACATRRCRRCSRCWCASTRCSRRCFRSTGGACCARVPPSMPDGIHLHSLIYRRVMRWAVGDRSAQGADAAQLDDLALPVGAVHAVGRAGHVVLGQHGSAARASCWCSASATWCLYWRIVRFRSPRWMRTLGSRPAPLREGGSAGK